MNTILRDWSKSNPWMTIGMVLQIVLAALALLGMAFDKREILGLNPWIKPFKFDISVFIMIATLAIFLSGLHRFSTLRLWVGGSFAIALTFENLLIALQALRGVRSHMNYTTPFNAKVFALMGLMLPIVTVAIILTLCLYFAEQPNWSKAVTWGIRLGLLLLLAGFSEGALMVMHGGHTVGAADGLAGLPITNWSRRHGDLRIAHFFALHAVQALPILGYLCSRMPVAERLQVTAVFCAAVLYSGLVWLLFRQAMAGTPLLG
jgi:hypothetical protein